MQAVETDTPLLKFHFFTVGTVIRQVTQPLRIKSHCLNAYITVVLSCEAEGGNMPDTQQILTVLTAGAMMHPKFILSSSCM